MKKLVKLYRKELHIPAKYFEFLRGKKDCCTNEITQDQSFLYGVEAMSNRKIAKFQKQLERPPICRVGDIRIDVPVWFGDFREAKIRICVVGLEPRHTDDLFNNLKKGKTVFASPFGADRWNDDFRVRGKPHKKYRRALAPVLNGNYFLLLTDVVKEFQVKSEQKKQNDTRAKRRFPQLARTWGACLKAEIAIVKPNLIVAFGKRAEKALAKQLAFAKINVVFVRHPSYGGEKSALEEIEAALLNAHI